MEQDQASSKEFTAWLVMGCIAAGFALAMLLWQSEGAQIYAQTLVNQLVSCF